MLTRRGFLTGAAALAGLSWMSGCAAREERAGSEAPDSKNLVVGEIEALSCECASLSAWSVYWDATGDAATVADHAGKLSALSLFAASFEDGSLVVPDATPRCMRRLRADERTADMPLFLSVVNDVKNGENVVQKDTEALLSLFATDDSCRQHAEELVALALDGGFDGIEIDYEKIRDDLALWEHFMVFENSLIARATQEGLRVRIVLEPSTPVEDLAFADGAEYSVMCYNLYGGGTKPGPKADYEFLDELAGRFGSLPGVSFALANGGYSWKAGTTEASQLKRADAERLVRAEGLEPTRADGSGALSFACKQDGVRREIWYADGETLALWAHRLADALGEKPRIDLWRL